MDYTYWIQHPDFSHEDCGAVDVSQAIKAVRSQDWANENAKWKAMENAGDECCDPGIGFVAADGRILHICPDGSGEFYFYVHFTKSRRLLGIFPVTSSHSRSKFNVPDSMIDELLEKFFQPDHDWLLSKTEEA